MNITYLLYCFVLSSRSNWQLFSQIYFPPPQTAANKCEVEVLQGNCKKGAFEKDVLRILMSQTLFLRQELSKQILLILASVSTLEIRQPHAVILLNTYIACEHFFNIIYYQQTNEEKNPKCHTVVLCHFKKVFASYLITSISYSFAECSKGSCNYTAFNHLH